MEQLSPLLQKMSKLATFCTNKVNSNQLDKELIDATNEFIESFIYFNNTYISDVDKKITEYSNKIADTLVIIIDFLNNNGFKENLSLYYSTLLNSYMKWEEDIKQIITSYAFSGTIIFHINKIIDDRQVYFVK